MKIIDFEIADSSLTKVTVVTEPRVSQRIYDIAKEMLKTRNFPTPSLHAGKLVFANAKPLTNPMNMEALRQALESAEKQVLDADEQEEQRRTQFLNQFRQAAGLPAK